MVPGVVSGQGALLLRRRLDLNATVHTAFQTVTRVTSSSGRYTESADLGAMRWIETTDGGGNEVLHLTYDSVRVRTRDHGGSWRGLAITDVDTAWVQIHMDDRMRVKRVLVGGELAGVTKLLPVLTGLPHLVLPERELAVGDRWLSETEIAVTGPGIEGATGRPGILGRAELKLDSIVARSSDTLGFITVVGHVGPTTLVSVGRAGAKVVASGAVRGGLVWSTGWGLFVSGAIQTRLEMTRGTKGASGDGDGDSLVMEKTTRYQVRP